MPGDDVPTEADFERAGLLDDLGEEEREARLALLHDLAEAGVGMAELCRAVAEGRLALLPAEHVLRAGGRHTAADVGRLSGLDPEFLARHYRAMGLPTPDADEPDFGDEDVESARALARFREAGLPEEGMMEITRVINQGLARSAEAIRDLVGETFLRAGDTERDLGLRYARVAEDLIPLMEPLLAHALRRHLRELIRSDVLGSLEIGGGRLPGARDVAVAFADLVGFTRLGEQLAASELGDVAGRLGVLASEIARPPVRLVKTIGDAAMLVSPEPLALLEALFALLDAARGEGERFPVLHAGIAHGPALARGGDWYGRPVNLASRVTDIARPDTILATRDLREQVGEHAVDWSFAGKRRLKGMEDAVVLFRVRPAGSGEGSG
jgi:adenylate cyclase